LAKIVKDKTKLARTTAYSRNQWRAVCTLGRVHRKKQEQRGQGLFWRPNTATADSRQDPGEH